MLIYNEEDFKEARIKNIKFSYDMVMNDAREHGIEIANIYFNTIDNDVIEFETKEDMMLYKMLGKWYSTPLLEHRVKITLDS